MRRSRNKNLADRTRETYLADDLALHEDAHGHVEAEELALHLELEVVLRCFPLCQRSGSVGGMRGMDMDAGAHVL